jgi:hypothetical protein
MTNKNLGKALIITLVIAFLLSFVSNLLCGLVTIANWVFVIIAANRLIKMKK